MVHAEKIGLPKRKALKHNKWRRRTLSSILPEMLGLLLQAPYGPPTLLEMTEKLAKKIQSERGQIAQLESLLLSLLGFRNPSKLGVVVD